MRAVRMRLAGTAKRRIAPIVCVLLCTSSWAGTTSYEYDALGRLSGVTRSDDSRTRYELDAAGNRTRVRELARPSAPPSLTVPSTSSTGNYTVSWKKVDQTVTAYELYESTSSTFSSQKRVFAGGGSSATITGRSEGRYYYRVRACNEDLCSGYTAGANSVLVAFPPSVPISISVPKTSSSGDYSIAWDAPMSGKVTAYELYESTKSNFDSQRLVYNDIGRQWPAVNVNTGTYYYRVRACNGPSCGDYMTGANAVVVDRTAPTQPGALSFTIDGISVRARWGASTDNIAVTQYEYRLNGAATWTNAGASTERLLPGLSEDTRYTFEVRARDAAGNASASRSGSFTTGSIPSPPVPTGLGASLMADCAWNATWAGSQGATYYVFKDTKGPQRNVTGLSTIVNCTVGKPDSNKPEWVRACNDLKCSSNAYFFATPDTTAPSKPGVPEFSAVTQTTATVAWKDSTDNVAVVGYRYRLNSGSWKDTSSVANVALTGLTPDTTYKFEVRARDMAGNLSASNSASFKTPAVPDTTKPSTPGTVKFSELTHYSVKASWGAATDNVGVTGYEWRLNNASTWTPLGNVLSVNVTGLQQLTTYSFEVRARDGAGNVGSARKASFTTKQGPPAAPTGLSYSQNANCSWRASWNAVVGATRYEVADTKLNVQSVTGTTAYISCPYNDPQANKPKWVQACNAAGCGTRANF